MLRCLLWTRPPSVHSSGRLHLGWLRAGLLNRLKTSLLVLLRSSLQSASTSSIPAVEWRGMLLARQLTSQLAPLHAACGVPFHTILQPLLQSGLCGCQLARILRSHAYPTAQSATLVLRLASPLPRLCCCLLGPLSTGQQLPRGPTLLQVTPSAVPRSVRRALPNDYWPLFPARAALLRSFRRFQASRQLPLRGWLQPTKLAGAKAGRSGAGRGATLASCRLPHAGHVAGLHLLARQV